MSQELVNFILQLGGMCDTHQRNPDSQGDRANFARVHGANLV